MGATSRGEVSTESGAPGSTGGAVGRQVAGDQRAERGDGGRHRRGQLGRELQRVHELEQQRDEARRAGTGRRGDDLALHARGLVRAGREDDLVLDRLQALEARLELVPLGVVRAVGARRVGARRVEAARRRGHLGLLDDERGAERRPLGRVHVVAHELVGRVLVGHADVGGAGVGEELRARRLGGRLAATGLVGAEVALARRPQRRRVLAGEHGLELSVRALVLCAHLCAPLLGLSGRTAAARSRGSPTARPGGGGERRRSPPRSGRGRSPCACCPRSSRPRRGRRPRRCRRGWPRRPR